MDQENTAKVWDPGFNKRFSLLRAGRTITLDRGLAEAFSHKPLLPSCEEDGTITHNVRKRAFFYALTNRLMKKRIFSRIRARRWSRVRNF